MDSEWIDDPRGRTLRVGDRVRYLDSRKVGPERVIQHASATGFTVDALPAVWRPRDYSTAHDRVLASTRWQYHAPTRAKLEAADRERVTVVSITDDTMTVQPAPPPDSEPGWDHVPADHVPRGGISVAAPGDRYYVEGLGWYLATRQSACMVHNDFHWIRRASHPERVRWLEERKRAINSPPSAAYVGEESTYAMVPSLGRAVNIGIALVTRDDAHEAVRDATAASAPTFPDECKPLMHFVPREFDATGVGAGDRVRYKAGPDARSIRVTVAVPPDPFAAVRAEAKRMLDDGADPRLVLGALDECVRREDPSMWKLQLAYYTVEATKDIARHIARASNEPCYHGNRAGTCGWCALSRDRSDARVTASHEPAWETADCEGE